LTAEEKDEVVEVLKMIGKIVGAGKSMLKKPKIQKEAKHV